ncbi:TPA: hypothetical protein H1008_01880, partial [archaeon]|nr:hypothetical protein [Candidatus Undinarchaeales archaeon SRR5007147.bin71]
MVNKLVTGGAVVVLFLVIGYVFFGAGGGLLGQFTGVGEAQEAVYVVGQNGLILKSTDGGDSWEEQDSGTTERLNTVYFTSIDIGFAAGLGGTLLKTTDGGDEWEQTSVNCGSIDPCYINDIHFPTSRVGYAAGWETYLKTSNGGNNWEYKMRSSYSDKLAVFFTDENTGYLAGKSRMLDKIEGDVIENLIPHGNPDWNDVYFTDEDTGYIVSSYGSVRKTTDGGESGWPESWQSVLDIDGNFKSIYFTDENTGYVAGAEIVWHGSQGGPYHTTGTILKTTDAGENWEELDLSVAERDDISRGYDVVPTLRSIHFANANEGYAVGHFGLILKTEDAGETWAVLRTAEGDEWLTSVFSIIQEAQEPESGEVRGAAKAFVSVTTQRGEERTSDSYYDEDGVIPVKEGDFVILSPNVDIVGDTLPSWIVDREEGTYTETTVVKWYDDDRRLRSIGVPVASNRNEPPFWWYGAGGGDEASPYRFRTAEDGEFPLGFEYILGEFDD